MLPRIFHTHWLSQYIPAAFVTRADANVLKKDATTTLTNPSNVPQRALAEGRDLDERRGRGERDLELSLYLQEQINYFKSKGDVDHLLAAQTCQCSQSPHHMTFVFWNSWPLLPFLHSAFGPQQISILHIFFTSSHSTSPSAHVPFFILLINEEADISCLWVAQVTPEISWPGAKPRAQLKRMAAAGLRRFCSRRVTQWDSNRRLGVNTGDGGGSTTQQSGEKVGRAGAERGVSAGVISFEHLPDADGWEEEALEIIYTWE